MAEQTMKLTWLRPGQSVRDYIEARGTENVENRAKNDKNIRLPSGAREIPPQIGRKTATRRSNQPWTSQRHISRMTPAPVDRSYDQEVRMPGWGDHESEDDGVPSSSKRSREPELAPRFIDLRAVQFRSDIQRQFHFHVNPSRRRFAGRKQTQEVEELIRRVGHGPQKKGQVVEQLAQSTRHGFRKNLAARRGAAFKSTSTFQAHMAAATQLGPEELNKSTHQIRSKSAMLRRAYGVRSSARKMPVMFTTTLSDDEAKAGSSFSSDTEEIDELDSSSSDAEPPPLIGRARKMPSRSPPPVDVGIQRMSKYRSEIVYEIPSEDEEVDLGRTAAQSQQFEPGPSTNFEEITMPTIDPEPLIQLFRAFQLHTLPTDIFQEAKQLPFLTRNLRQSFRSLCLNLGIPVIPLPHDQQGTILVRYEHVANASFERSVPKWFCPLCNLLGKLATMDMLTVHLKTYHRELYVEWLQPTENELREGISWRLHILIHGLVEKVIGHVSPSPDPAETVEPELEITDMHTPPEPQEPSNGNKQTPPTTPQKTRVSAFPLTPAARDDPSMLFLSDERPSVSPQSRATAPVISPLTSPRSQKGKKPSTPGQLKPRPSQYPRPPPSSDRLGAAARPPYLPAKSTFGGPDVYYSTRFSGPCLFDLLDLLPLEPFGIFDGMVIDREEEIYNDDDLAQEDKVIVALWARWVMLNKVEFDQDRAGGVKKFIDEYWRMVHLAAGWQALVHQLLVLAAWRLLKPYEIIALLEHYEELVGMQYWDEWDSNEE